jgi:hypothetical protein
MFFSLSHDCNGGSLIDGIHECAGRSQAGTHNISTAENEADCTFVDLLLGQEPEEIESVNIILFVELLIETYTGNL